MDECGVFMCLPQGFSEMEQNSDLAVIGSSFFNLPATPADLTAGEIKIQFTKGHYGMHYATLCTARWR